jgi:predicted dehydrogenase
MALVGCGDVAGTYLRATTVAKRCLIIQVMDINLALAQQRGRELGVPATASFDAVLANPEVDAVILSVPHYLHAPMTIRALESGKHVMCDKPIATTVADGEKMIAAAAQTGRKLTINYAMRCSDKARYARRLIREGLLGDIFAITIIGARAKPAIYWEQGWRKVTKTDWRMSKAKAGGGVMLMNESHSLDLLLSLTGLHAVAVVGMAGTYNSPPRVGVEDLAAGVLRLSNGGLATVLASSCYLGGLLPHESILGKRGQMEYVCVNNAIRVFLTDAGGRDIKTDEWVELPVPASGKTADYPGLMDEFADAVLDGAPVPVAPRDALHTLASILAIYGHDSPLPIGYVP